MNQFGLRDADAGFKANCSRKRKRLPNAMYCPGSFWKSCCPTAITNVLRPAYSSLQNIVSIALREERKRLVTKLYTDADKGLREQLDQTVGQR